MVNVRYMVDDVQAAVDFYTAHLGFTLRFTARTRVRRRQPGQPAAAAGRPGQLRGPADARRRARPGRVAGTASTSSSTTSTAEVARLRAEGVSFRNDIVTGPGGKQILLEDPSGNVVELFQPAASRA